MTTAIDWYRQSNNVALELPDTPVGPDLAVGLSQDFGADAFDAIDWEIALEVDILLTHGDRGPLPVRSVIEMDAQNQAAADIATLPNLTDGDYRTWRRPRPVPRPLPDLPWFRNTLAYPHASGSVLERSER